MAKITDKLRHLVNKHTKAAKEADSIASRAKRLQEAVSNRAKTRTK